jgi:long-chain-fatty-acid--CoA ligase ACSBG
LPLSHVAGLFADLIAPLISGYHVYFAQPDALQGTIINTLKEVRPIAFFSVPRVWEKIDEKMKQIAKQNGWLKTKIANWAKSIGPEGTVQEIRKQPTSL